ncbi:hypothetical protein HMPREF3197_03615 [Klebsiella pneumoniae]|nr:hypothetical protein HMPREF3197_03615 [Klebsiella pneumoniae]
MAGPILPCSVPSGGKETPICYTHHFKMFFWCYQKRVCLL